MPKKVTHTPLDDKEREELLRYIWRLVQTAEAENVQRAAKSLFTLMTQEKYSD